MARVRFELMVEAEELGENMIAEPSIVKEQYIDAIRLFGGTITKNHSREEGKYYELHFTCDKVLMDAFDFFLSHTIWNYQIVNVVGS